MSGGCALHWMATAEEEAAFALFNTIIRALEETGDVGEPSFEMDEKVLRLAAFARAQTAEVMG